MYFLQVPMVADKDQDPRTRAIRSFHLLRLNLLLHIFPVITLVSITRLIYYANLSTSRRAFQTGNCVIQRYPT